MPLKVSKPQAVTAADLTDAQIQTLIANKASGTTLLQSDDTKLLTPAIPLYLPDPERNKRNDDDDDYVPDKHQQKEKADSSSPPIKLTLALDTYSPVATNFARAIDDPISVKIQAAQNDKSSYSYNDRYDYYFPVKVIIDDDHKYADKELELMEMKPPAEPNANDDEPNYYVTKPKKIPKKYQPNKKDVNQSKSSDDNNTALTQLIPIDNDGLVLPSEQSSFVTSQPVERFAPAPEFRRLSVEDLNIGEYIPGEREFKEQRTESITLPESTVATVLVTSTASSPADIQRRSDSGDLEMDRMGRAASPSSDRVEYQMHGFKGPNSYRFGFDTGKG